MSAVGIAEVTIGAGECRVQVRSPGIVRGAAFRLHEKLIVAGTEPEFEEELVLFVESDPDAPIRARTFVAMQSGQAFRAKSDVEVTWTATALSERTGSHAHVFEIREAKVKLT